jgi:hypothetical protein
MRTRIAYFRVIYHVTCDLRRLPSERDKHVGGRREIQGCGSWISVSERTPRRSAFWEAYSRPLVTASSTPTSSSTSNRLQPRVCCTVSIPFASLSAHAMMDVWICSSFVFLACVGFVDPSCIFGVLAYLFLFASSFPGIRSLYRHGLVSRTTSPLGIKITSPKLDVGTPRCPNQYKLLCLLCQPSRSDTRTYKNLLTGNIKPDTLQFH